MSISPDLLEINLTIQRQVGRLAEDAHLLDSGNLQEIAPWIVSAAGVVLGGTVEP